MAKKNQFLIEGLFSFDGRFRRSEYWIASIGLAVVRLVVMGIGAVAMGLSFTAAGAIMPARVGLDLLFLWPSAAILIKRGHDRNRPAMFSGGLLAVTYVLAWAAMALKNNNAALGVIGVLMMVIGVYMLIDYGLIDGTKGPNRYGASPKGHPGAGADIAKTFD